MWHSVLRLWHGSCQIRITILIASTTCFSFPVLESGPRMSRATNSSVPFARYSVAGRVPLWFAWLWAHVQKSFTVVNTAYTMCGEYYSIWVLAYIPLSPGCPPIVDNASKGEHVLLTTKERTFNCCIDGHYSSLKSTLVLSICWSWQSFFRWRLLRTWVVDLHMYSFVQNDLAFIKFPFSLIRYCVYFW